MVTHPLFYMMENHSLRPTLDVHKWWIWVDNALLAKVLQGHQVTGLTKPNRENSRELLFIS